MVHLCHNALGEGHSDLSSVMGLHLPGSACQAIEANKKRALPIMDSLGGFSKRFDSGPSTVDRECYLRDLAEAFLG